MAGDVLGRRRHAALGCTRPRQSAVKGLYARRRREPGLLQFGRQICAHVLERPDRPRVGAGIRQSDYRTAALRSIQIPSYWRL